MVPLRDLVPNLECPGTMLVPLSQGRFAIIDERDAGIVNRHNWCLVVTHPGRTPYAVTTVVVSGANGERLRRKRYLHRFLWTHWGRPPSPELDHVNGDGLDCRRNNLRAATTSQNQQNRKRESNNTSGHKGVYWCSRDKRWRAVIWVSGQRRCLGSFLMKDAAVRAYAVAAAESFGEFARSA